MTPMMQIKYANDTNDAKLLEKDKKKVVLKGTTLFSYVKRIT